MMIPLTILSQCSDAVSYLGAVLIATCVNGIHAFVTCNIQCAHEIDVEIGWWMELCVRVQKLTSNTHSNSILRILSMRHKSELILGIFPFIQL